MADGHGCRGCCTCLLYSLFRRSVLDMSLTPQPTLIVRDLSGYGPASCSSDKPLVLPIPQERAVPAECWPLAGGATDVLSRAPVEHPPERHGFNLGDRKLQVYRSLGPCELRQNEPSCFVFSERLPSVSEGVARVCLLVPEKERPPPRSGSWSTSLEDRVTGSGLTWRNAELRVLGPFAETPRCSQVAASASGTQGARRHS
jgi:hypothetical protein